MFDIWDSEISKVFLENIWNESQNFRNVYLFIFNQILDFCNSEISVYVHIALIHYHIYISAPNSDYLPVSSQKDFNQMCCPTSEE